MKCSRLTSNSGITLVELLVALALAMVVMAGITAGVVFLQRQLTRWSEDTNWLEECAFARAQLASICARSAATTVFADSIVCDYTDGRHLAICWQDSTLTVNGRPLLRNGIKIGPLAVSEFSLSPSYNANEIKSNARGRRSIRMSFAMCTDRRPGTTITFAVREVHAYATFEIDHRAP